MLVRPNHDIEAVLSGPRFAVRGQPGSVEPGQTMQNWMISAFAHLTGVAVSRS
jgi:hypothetical protein